MDTSDFGDANYSQMLQAYHLKPKIMSKVYFNHTTKLEPVRLGLRPAATIALKRVGNNFQYGVSICSHHDNFSRKLGRAIAQDRLEKEFRVTAIPKELLEFGEEHGEQNMMLVFLYQLAKSITLNTKKWKKKVTKFNMQQEATKLEEMRKAKIVVMEQPIKEEVNH